jgi:hypothetical protein
MRPSNCKEADAASRRVREQAIQAETIEALKTEIEAATHRDPAPPDDDKRRAHASAHAANIALIQKEMGKREPDEDKRRRENAARAQDIEWIKRDMLQKAQTRAYSGGYITPDDE